MCLVVAMDGVTSVWESECLHDSALGVGNREVDWFIANDVLVDAVEAQEVRWRTHNKPLEKGLVENANVAHINVVCVYVVGPCLS